MVKTEVIIWVLSAVSIILWWSIVNHNKLEELGESYWAFVKNVHSLYWLSKVLSHLAFYVSASAGLIGFEKDTSIAYCFAAWWFFCALYVSHSYMLLAESIAADKKSLLTFVEESRNV